MHSKKVGYFPRDWTQRRIARCLHSFRLPYSRFSEVISGFSRPKSFDDIGAVGGWLNHYQHSGDRTLDAGCAINPKVLAVR